jgi:thiamine monophosphate kinase
MLDAEEASRAVGVALTRVGRVEAGDGVWLEEAGGALAPVGRGGFSHFGSDGS